MLRKIIQLGAETFVISLPRAWTKQHILKKGDELEMEEAGPKLIIYPKSEAKSGKVSVDVSGTWPITKRVLGALYKAGYDEIEIKFGSPKDLEVVQHTIRDSFVGFEIVSKTKQTLVAKNVSEPRHEEFDTLLRRVFLLLLEMGEGCFKALASKDFDMLETVAAMDEDINRHVNFCRRTLNTIGHRVVTRIAPAYYVVEQLERTGDCYKHLCSYLSKSKLVASSLLEDLLADANAFIRKFYELHYKLDSQSLVEFWNDKEMFEKKLAESIGMAGKKELPAMFLISQIIENVAGANGALLTARA